MVSKYYRNRISMDALLSKPLGFLHYLYYTAVQESQTDEGKAYQANALTEEAMEDNTVYPNRGGRANGARRVPPRASRYRR